MPALLPRPLVSGSDLVAEVGSAMPVRKVHFGKVVFEFVTCHAEVGHSKDPTPPNMGTIRSTDCLATTISFDGGERIFEKAHLNAETVCADTASSVCSTSLAQTEDEGIPRASHEYAAPADIASAPVHTGGKHITDPSCEDWEHHDVNRWGAAADSRRIKRSVACCRGGPLVLANPVAGSLLQRRRSPPELQVQTRSIPVAVGKAAEPAEVAARVLGNDPLQLNLWSAQLELQSVIKPSGLLNSILALVWSCSAAWLSLAACE